MPEYAHGELDSGCWKAVHRISSVSVATPSMFSVSVGSAGLGWDQRGEQDGSPEPCAAVTA
jgi:hypothetical protein